MASKKTPETASEVLQALQEFLAGPEPDFSDKPIDEVRNYLKKRKLKTESVLRTAQEELARARGELALEEARTKRGDVLNKLAARAAVTVAGTKEELLERLRELAGPQHAAVYFRNLADPSEDDLRSLIEDLERLKELEPEPEGEDGAE